MTDKKLQSSSLDDLMSTGIMLLALCGTTLALTFNAGIRYAENKVKITKPQNSVAVINHESSKSPAKLLPE